MDKSRPYRFVVQTLAALFLISVSLTSATTFTVSKIDDTADGICDSDCSLREAVIAANQRPGGDVILLDSPGTYTLQLSGLEEDRSRSGDLDVTDDLEIRGRSASVSIIDAIGLSRVFDIAPGTGLIDVKISHVSMRGGQADQGGAILNRGRLELEKVRVDFNRATAGGGIANLSGSRLTLRQSVIQDNEADSFGGGIDNSGDLLLVETFVYDNRSAVGSALMNIGSVSFKDSRISGECESRDGAIVSQNGNLEGPGDTCRLTLATDQVSVSDGVLIPPDEIFSDDFEMQDTTSWSSTFPNTGCDGQMVGGFCWWFGANNESCNEVCADHGGYNSTTESFAGSSGSNANCASVLTALDIFNPTPVTDVSTVGGIGGLGCGSDYTGTATSYRLTSTTTPEASSASAGGLFFRRACACNFQPPPGGLSYNEVNIFTQGIPITPLVPSITGFVASWSISPSLPTGLTLDSITGEISGNPIALQGTIVHTVKATNAGGSSTALLSVEVIAAPPTGLSYESAPFSFTQNAAIVPQTPVVTGFVESFSINPAQPSGLSFNTNDGTISGTPTSAQGPTNYTVTASNSAGNDAVVISIEVTAPFSCDGEVVGGFCWYFGTNNQSCDTVCGTHGGYNSATETFAGSAGTNGNCGDVLTALSIISPTPVSDVTTLGGISGLGCGSDYTDNATSYRLTTTTTSGASSGSNGGLFFRRACACND